MSRFDSCPTSPNIKGEKMNCPRCGGKVTPEKFYGEQGVFDGWRCIMCGDVFDEVILERRKVQRRELLWQTGEMIFLDRDLVIGVTQKDQR